MGGRRQGFALLQLVWVLAGILVIGAAAWYPLDRLRVTSLQFPTSCQAVLLSNGSVYFGHLQGYGSRQQVLTEVD